MFIILIGMIVLLVYIYIKIHETLDFMCTLQYFNFTSKKLLKSWGGGGIGRTNPTPWLWFESRSVP